MTRRVWLVVLATAGACGILASAAMAAHFTKKGEPACTDTGTTLVCTGELAGLGNEDLVIDLTSDAQATFLCGTPGNGNLAPGANKVPLQVGGSQTITGGAIKNGRAVFSVSAPGEAPTATAEQAGCPNGQWQVVRIVDIDFANVELTIAQGGETLFSCTYPGEVPEGQKVALSCV
jgi:hypothetical protein